MTLDQAQHFQPFGNKILVRRLPLSDQTQSGLYLLGRDFPTVGVVLSVGSGARSRKFNYQRQKLDLSKGDLVQWAVDLSDYDLKLVGPDILLLDYADLNFVFPPAVGETVLKNLQWTF